MTAADLIASLDAIAGRARDLRDAGVTSVEIGPIKFSLASKEAPAERAGRAVVTEESDPLKDPALYGGFVPSFPRHPMTNEDS